MQILSCREIVLCSRGVWGALNEVVQHVWHGLLHKSGHIASWSYGLVDPCIGHATYVGVGRGHRNGGVGVGTRCERPYSRYVGVCTRCGECMVCAGGVQSDVGGLVGAGDWEMVGLVLGCGCSVSIPHISSTLSPFPPPQLSLCLSALGDWAWAAWSHQLWVWCHQANQHILNIQCCYHGCVLCHVLGMQLVWVWGVCHCCIHAVPTGGVLSALLHAYPPLVPIVLLL